MHLHLKQAFLGAPPGQRQRVYVQSSIAEHRRDVGTCGGGGEMRGGAGMGCPTKRTDANRATILRALKHGASYKRAAEAAGISYETFRTWRESDPAFSAALQKAQAAMTAKALRAIEEAHQSGAWQAAAWWLERTFPEEYGRTVHHAMRASRRSSSR